MEIDERIKFDEVHIDEDFTKTATYYFTAEKSCLDALFPNEYPDADGMTISVEVPTDQKEAAFARVAVSPMKDGCDSDWTGINLPHDEIQAFLDLGQTSYIQSIRKLWEDFGSVPMDPETEETQTAWNVFPKGTHRESIWHWFEETFSISIAKDLMY